MKSTAQHLSVPNDKIKKKRNIAIVRGLEKNTLNLYTIVDRMKVNMCIPQIVPATNDTMRMLSPTTAVK